MRLFTTYRYCFGNAYCQPTDAPMPTKLANVPVTAPPIFGRLAVKVELAVPEATSMNPPLAAVAGNCVRIAVGTVNVFCPAVVRQ